MVTPSRPNKWHGRIILLLWEATRHSTQCSLKCRMFYCKLRHGWFLCLPTHLSTSNRIVVQVHSSGWVGGTNNKATATHELTEKEILRNRLDFMFTNSTRSCGICSLPTARIGRSRVFYDGCHFTMCEHAAWLRWLPQANAVTVRCPFGAPWHRRPASSRLINSPGGDTVARCSVCIVTWIGRISSGIRSKRSDAVHS